MTYEQFIESKAQIGFKPFYDENGITIYCADNRRVLPCLPQIDLLLTDPPYGIGFAEQPTTGQRKRGQPRETWDDAAPDEWTLLLARQLCIKQIIWGGNYFGLPRSRCWLSWYKPDAPPSMGNVEYAWTNLDQNSRQIEQSIAATNAEDRKSTRLNSSHIPLSRMPSSA